MFKKLFENVLSGFIQDFYSNDAGEKRIFIVVFFPHYYGHFGKCTKDINYNRSVGKCATDSNSKSCNDEM